MLRYFTNIMPLSTCFISVCSVLIAVSTALTAATTDEQLLWRPCDVYGCGNGAVCNRTSLECRCSDAVSQAGPQCQTVGELCNQRCHIAGTVEGIGGAQCDNLTGECICKDNFAGSTCDTPRVQATCDAISMTIEVIPFDYSDGSGFSGTIFGSPTDSFSSLPLPCTLTNNGGHHGITLDYSSMNGDCAQPIDTFDSDGNKIKLFHFYIQHINNYQLHSDHKIRVTCAPAGADDIRAAQITDITAYDLSAYRSTHAESDGVTMDLMHEDFIEYFTPIISPLSLADPVALIIQHKYLFGIERCVASDRLSGGSEISLISDWCAPNCAAPLYREPIGHSLVTDTEMEGGSGSNIAVRLPLQAWHFPGTTQVYITCDICLDEGCAPVTEPRCIDNNLANLLVDKTHAYLAKGVKRPRRATCTGKESARRRRRHTAKSTRRNPNTAASMAQKQNEKNKKNLKIPGRNRLDHSQVAQTSLTVSVLVNDPNNGKGVKRIPRITEDHATTENCYESMAVVLPMGFLVILLIITTLLTIKFCLHTSRNNYQWETDEKLIQGLTKSPVMSHYNH